MYSRQFVHRPLSQDTNSPKVAHFKQGARQPLQRLQQQVVELYVAVGDSLVRGVWVLDHCRLVWVLGGSFGGFLLGCIVRSSPQSWTTKHS